MLNNPHSLPPNTALLKCDSVSKMPSCDCETDYQVRLANGLEIRTTNAELSTRSFTNEPRWVAGPRTPGTVIPNGLAERRSIEGRQWLLEALSPRESRILLLCRDSDSHPIWQESGQGCSARQIWTSVSCGSWWALECRSREVTGQCADGGGIVARKHRMVKTFCLYIPKPLHSNGPFFVSYNSKWHFNSWEDGFRGQLGTCMTHINRRFPAISIKVLSCPHSESHLYTPGPCGGIAIHFIHLHTQSKLYSRFTRQTPRRSRPCRSGSAPCSSAACPWPAAVLPWRWGSPQPTR